MRKPNLTSPIPMGQVVMTPGIASLIDSNTINPLALLARHQSGDYGDVGAEDWLLNDEAVSNGQRILSSYQIQPELKVWIITEADRSSTTLLLPD